MKRRLYSLLLMSLMLLTGGSAWAELQTDETGAYLIGSKEDLKEWTTIDGYEKTNVVLTADIDGLDFMLCTNSASYNGVFDGKGHTITLNYDFSGKQTGLFYNFAGTVKNLIVGGTIKATFKNCACLAAWNWSNSAKFENVAAVASILVDWTGNTSDAGFVGYSKYSITFNNCLSAIKVSGNQGYNHGFVGWLGGNNVTMNNCICIEEAETSNTMSWGNPTSRVTLSNCYTIEQDGDPGDAQTGSTYINADMVKSGELCYKINGDQKSINWYQTIGEDDNPVPFSTHKQVYAQGDMRCDGVALGDVTYTNSNDTPAPKHNDVDGFCSVCGNIITDHLTPNAQGYYELGTAKDVEWFAAMVNDAHNLEIKGMLTADIDYEGVENAHTPIGLNTNYKYNGVFDGQGHRIKGMIINNPESNMQGFFGCIRGGTEIRNLILDASCSVTGAGQTGGIVGCVNANTGTPILIENCVNEATITATSAAGGIIGAGQSGYPQLDVRNCLNTGDVTGNPATAFCAWINCSGCQFTNCINTGNITGVDMAGNKYSYYCNLIRYEPNTLTMTNCWDFSDFDDQGAGHQGVREEGWETEDPLAGGEVCYNLNGNQQTINWYQKLGEDATPVPYYIEGGQIYLNGDVNCDGTPIGAASYSNNKTSEIPAHEYEDGFCVNCGGVQLDYAPEEDGYKMIGTASQLYWFSRMVSEFGYATWNAKLTADIDMDEYNDLFVPIGNLTYSYRGTFDGQNHKISNLHVNSTDRFTGMFGRVGSGVVIENLLLDETCSISGTTQTGMVGGTNQSGTVTLSNLGNMGNVYTSNSNAQTAGIFGGNDGSQATLVISNCFTTGAIEGVDGCSAIVGWAGSKSLTVSGCWSCSEVTGADREDLYMVRLSSGTLENCFSVYGTQCPNITFDDIANGTLCYKLNGDQSNIVWYQNIDNGAEVDDQPLPFKEGHAQVYPKGKMLCDGTVDPSGVTYSNSNDVVIPNHQFTDGFCSACGQEDPDYEGFVKVISNPDFTTNNADWAGTAPAVSNGVAEQAGTTFDTYQDIKVPQTGVYKLRVQGFTRVAALSADNYAEGELDNDLLRNTYYYAESDSMRTARRLMDITAGAQTYKQNDGVGEEALSNELYVPSTTAGAAKYFGKGKYWNEPLYLAATSTDVRIGISNQFSGSGSWNVIDRLRLEYVGNDAAAYALIAKQTVAEGQNLEEVESQETLKEEYSKIIEDAASMTDAAEILAAADKAARMPDEIRLSEQAYTSYIDAVNTIYTQWQGRDDLIGEAADKLETYLTSSEEPGDEFPNGSFNYIKENRLLSNDQLAEETDYAGQLWQDAVKNCISEGADVTALIVNPNFDKDAAWYGWTAQGDSTLTNWNLVCNAGFTDVFPVAAGYNTGFEVAQELKNVPNGIYELRANAFYRPGAAKEGLMDGTDVIPASLFLNDYNTPILSVYADMIQEEDAENGVNCRLNATTDETAPHNGEQTASVDLNTGYGYVPDNVYTASFAFHGDRYAQKAYAVVTDGTLRLGVRNTANPWHAKCLTVWGGFKLTYQGKSTDVISDMLEQYSTRVDLLDGQRFDQEYYLSQSHIDNIRAYINQAQSAGSVDNKLTLIGKINDEFNTIASSHDLYAQLQDVSQFANDMADGLEEGTDLQQKMVDTYDELSNIIVDGSMTDAEVQAKLNDLLEDPSMGTVYVQGDLYDPSAENGEWTYSKMCTLYPLSKNAEGKWVGSVTLQDRSRRINGYARAGFYFRRINTIFKCGNPNRNFLTPARLGFKVQEDGSDFQALNGTYDICLDLENDTVSFELLDEYNWGNQVYVTGTLNNKAGTTVRWSNSEIAPLQHIGNGKYVGMVELVYDNSNPYCSFGIMTNRSTNNAANYQTNTRSSWTEARYGSDEQYLEITSGQTCTDLERGLDRTWRISPAGKYMIEFDMDNRTMTATLLDTKGKGSEKEPYQIATKADLQTMQDRMTAGKTTYFKLMNDIDMSDTGWWPLNSNFFGSSVTEGHNKFVNFDGNHHIIKNLQPTVNNENYYETGFFGCLVGSVKNLGIYNATVQGGNTVSAGILAGYLGDESYVNTQGEALTTTVDSCYFTGTLTAEQNAGAIAGTVLSNAAITNCYSNANIAGTPVDGSFHGDFVGEVQSDLTIQSSYAAGQYAGSDAKGILGEGQTATQTNTLYYDGTNLSTICSIVPNWNAGWNNNGTIGNGYPILQWQVDRGDYQYWCGYGDDPDAIRTIEADGTNGIFSDTDGIYNLQGQRVSRVQHGGIYIVNGKKVAVR